MSKLSRSAALFGLAIALLPGQPAIAQEPTLRIVFPYGAGGSADAVARLCYLSRPFDPDGAMFIYMGKLTAEGGRLCHDLIDNKFPSVGMMTSVPWQMSLSASLHDIWNTMFWPLVILVLARRTDLFGPRPAAMPADIDPDT